MSESRLPTRGTAGPQHPGTPDATVPLALQHCAYAHCSANCSLPQELPLGMGLGWGQREGGLEADRRVGRGTAKREGGEKRWRKPVTGEELAVGTAGAAGEEGRHPPTIPISSLSAGGTQHGRATAS